MKKAMVLGCGLVGATMARDLSTDPDLDVTVADVRPENLRKLQGTARIKTVQEDLADPRRVAALIEPCDVVLGALPSRFGFATLKAVIESVKPFCDISFMDQDPLELDDLARKKGVTAVIDCGVSPGLSNMIIGFVYSKLDQTDSARIYVGGVPKLRHWPFQYKAPFAPADVIEEYTRPARLVENGAIVVKPALSEQELLDFPRVGTLEAFNTDGLRTLLTTVAIRDMSEKTLRYPGHCELMKVFRETGFFSRDLIDVSGVTVCPLDVTARLLFPKWTYQADEEEVTVLRVIVEGRRGGESLRYTYDLYDEYDRPSGTSSMARTTAFPAAIVARMLASGRLHEPGVLPPERLAQRPGVFEMVVEALRSRGVTLKSQIERIDRPSGTGLAISDGAAE